MRHNIVVLSFLFFITFQSFSQVAYFSGGYNASFVNPKGFNMVVDRYNSARTWMSKPMEQIDYLDGAFWSFSGISKTFLLDLSLSRRSTILSAQGDNGSGMMQRDLKFSAHTINMGMGLNLSRNPPFFGIGYNLDFGINKVKTRLGTPENIKEVEFSELDAPLFIGSSVYAQLFITRDTRTGLGLIIRPYYHFDFLDINYTWIDNDLTPYANQSNLPSVRGKLNHFGLNVALAIKIGA